MFLRYRGYKQGSYYRLQGYFLVLCFNPYGHRWRVRALIRYVYFTSDRLPAYLDIVCGSGYFQLRRQRIAIQGMFGSLGEPIHVARLGSWRNRRRLWPGFHDVPDDLEQATVAYLVEQLQIPDPDPRQPFPLADRYWDWARANFEQLSKHADRRRRQRWN